MSQRLPSGITIERRFGLTEPVVADSSALNQVWLNLIDNAIHAVGARGRVVLETRRDGADAVISIADDGAGISADPLPHVFEPFFSTRTATDGTGLGLALCRR